MPEIAPWMVQARAQREAEIARARRERGLDPLPAPAPTRRPAEQAPARAARRHTRSGHPQHAGTRELLRRSRFEHWKQSVDYEALRPLAQLRYRLNLTQGEAAKASGIGRVTYRAAEAGRHVSETTRDKIEQALGVRP